MKKEEIDAMLKEALDPLKAELGIANAIAKMNDITKVHYETLDEEGKTAFLAKSADDQAAVLKAADVIKQTKIDGSESIVLHGQTIVKSECGAGVFEILKAQQIEIDKSKAETKVEKDARQIGEFTKMAEGLYPNLPGEPVLKGKVMKAISEMSDKETQDAVTAMLKSGNDAVETAKSFDELGHSFVTPGADTPVAELNKMAQTKADTDKISFAKAYSAVLETEEGAELYEKTLKK